ncbi:DUF645 family protein, partial [Vibrio cholerae]
WLSLSRTLNRGKLNFDRFRFWSSTSQLLAVCLMLLRKIAFQAKVFKSYLETIGYEANKRLKRDCQRVAFPVPLSRGGCSCCV